MPVCVCRPDASGTLMRLSGSMKTGVTDNWEPVCRFLEVNLGFLKEQKVLLTKKSFIQPPEHYCDDKYCSVLS